MSARHVHIFPQKQVYVVNRTINIQQPVRQGFGGFSIFSGLLGMMGSFPMMGMSLPMMGGFGFNPMMNFQTQFNGLTGFTGTYPDNTTPADQDLTDLKELYGEKYYICKNRNQYYLTPKDDKGKGISGSSFADIRNKMIGTEPTEATTTTTDTSSNTPSSSDTKPKTNSAASEPASSASTSAQAEPAKPTGESEGNNDGNVPGDDEGKSDEAITEFNKGRGTTYRATMGKNGDKYEIKIDGITVASGETPDKAEEIFDNKIKSGEIKKPGNDDASKDRYEIRESITVPLIRGAGAWHYAQCYKTQDGKSLTSAQMREVMNLLIASKDMKYDYQEKVAKVPSGFTLSDGTNVYLMSETEITNGITDGTIKKGTISANNGADYIIIGSVEKGFTPYKNNESMGKSYKTREEAVKAIQKECPDWNN